MARTPGKINKSQAIRDVLGANPKIKTRDVVAQLGDKGIKVTPTLVYFIKSREKKAKRKAGRERVVESMRQSGAKSPVELIVRLKELSRDVGGLKVLKQLVDVLAE